MRVAVRFVLLRNGFQFPTPAAYSQEIQVQNPNEPTSGHLALTGTPGWVTIVAKPIHIGQLRASHSDCTYPVVNSGFRDPK
jgi:hypothetical protein